MKKLIIQSVTGQENSLSKLKTYLMRTGTQCTIYLIFDNILFYVTQVTFDCLKIFFMAESKIETKED